MRDVSDKLCAPFVLQDSSIGVLFNETKIIEPAEVKEQRDHFCMFRESKIIE